MANDLIAIARYAEQYNDSDPVMDTARTTSADIRRRPIAPTTASALTMLTHMLAPESVAQLGTGTGSAAIALLRGMPAHATLTTIDTDANAQRIARELIEHAALGTHKFRMITGRPETVITRLAQAAYQLVYIDLDAESTARAVPHALDKLCADGILIINGVLDSEVANPAKRAPDITAKRQLLSALKRRTDVSRVLLPLDEGLLLLRRS